MLPPKNKIKLSVVDKLNILWTKYVDNNGDYSNNLRCREDQATAFVVRSSSTAFNHWAKTIVMMWVNEFTFTRNWDNREEKLSTLSEIKIFLS